MRRHTGIGLVTLLLAWSGACGDDAADSSSSGDLAELVDAVLEPVGLDYTYGSVSEVDGRRHLALYAEPTGASTDQDYLDRIVSSTALIAPYVFERFSSIDSFDLCQEPVPVGPDDPDYPEPRTAVFLTRDQAAGIADWSALTLVELMRAAREGEGGEVRVDESIAALPDYVAALAAVEETGPDPG